MKTRISQLALAVVLACVMNPATAQEDIDAAPETRIVGGVDFDINSAPATVALLSNAILAQTGSYDKAQFCGGTVISARWVVTAAHCITDENGPTPASQISVMMGTTDLQAPVNQPIGITRVIAHNGYDPDDTKNDIALLQLEYDALVTPARVDTQPVSLNDAALITGWGALNARSETDPQFFPTVLQAAVVNMIPGDECGSMFPLYSGSVDTRNLCAGVPAGGVDSCQGDSGGPLYRFDPTRTASILTGVVSWGFGCADAQAPGVYTHVAAFSDWLRNTTGASLTGAVQPLIGGRPSEDDPVPASGPATVQQSIDSQLSMAAAGSSGSLMLLVLAGLATWRNTSYRAKRDRLVACTANTRLHRLGQLSNIAASYQQIAIDLRAC